MDSESTPEQIEEAMRNIEKLKLEAVRIGL